MAVGVMASAVHIAAPTGTPMMPILRSPGTSDAEAYGTGRTVARPANLVATDVVVIVARADSSTANIACSGFTRVFNQQFGSSDIITVAVLVGTGFSGAGTFAMTSSQGSGEWLSTTCTAWMAATTSVVVGTSLAVNTPDGTETVPAVTTPGNNSVVLLCGGQVFGGNEGVTSSTPTTARIVANNGVFQRSRTQATAGTSGTIDVACTAFQNIVSVQVAIPGLVWSPLDLAALLETWLDPTDAAKFTVSGTEVLTWTDKSSNAYVATGAALAAANRPNRNGSINGVTVLTFDGADWLRTNIPATLKPLTFAVVFNMTAGTTDRSLLGSSAAAAAGDGGWQMRASFTTDEFCLNTSNTAEIIRSIAVPEGLPTILVLTYSGTGVWTLRYNRLQVGTGTNNATPTAARFHLVGNNNYTSAVEAITGTIGDIVLSDSVLTGSNLEYLEAWMTSRYSIGPFIGPTFVAAGAFQAEASTTALGPMGLPAGLVANDIMFMPVMLNAAGTFSTPAGWTQFGTLINNANQSTNWFWRRYQIGDTAPSTTTSVTMSATIGGYGRIYAFRGCTTTGTPFEATANAGTTSTTTPASSAITTLGPNRLAVSFAMIDAANTYSAGNPPTSWVLPTANVTSTTGGDAMFGVITSEMTTAGAVAAVNHGTMTAAFWRTLTLALIPA